MTPKEKATEICKNNTHLLDIPEVKEIIREWEMDLNKPLFEEDPSKCPKCYSLYVPNENKWQKCNCCGYEWTN